MRRKPVLVLPVLIAMMASACSQPAPEHDPATRHETAPRVSHVQVTAHPDDDILFMNPDLTSGIRQGQSTVSIYLTGGESSLANPQEYVSQRQDGTRAAYAQMAAVPNEWTRKTIRVPGDRVVEVDELRARPDVKVVFLNLPEDNNPTAAGGKHALNRLRDDRAGATAVNTLLPDAGKVRKSYSYRRSDVVATLAALFDRFGATTIRLQDPQPDTRYQPEWVGFHDHPDHMIGAQLARESAQRYLARPGRHAEVFDYRDYNVADTPVNLSATEREAKRAVFRTYSEHDSEASPGGSYADWTTRSRYRWPRGGAWAGRDGRGQVHAFAVQGDEMAHWKQTADGWRAPRRSPTPGPIRPTLRVVRDHQGRLVLFAQSLDGTRVLMKRQSATGTWPVNWQSLGQPQSRGSTEEPTQSGVPTVAVDGQGRLTVLVTNADGGLSVRREASAGSGNFPADWRNLGGSDVQDGVSAVLGPDDRLNVFAATNERVLHWQEQKVGQPLASAPERFGNVRPAGSPVAIRTADRKVKLFVRTAGGSAIAAFGRAPGAGWNGPEKVPNPGGLSPPAVAEQGGPDRTRAMMFVRDGAGNVSATQQERDGDYSGWTGLGGPVLEHPSALTGPTGAVTLLAVGGDGRLLSNQQVRGSTGLRFDGWHPAGPHRGSAEAVSPPGRPDSDTPRQVRPGAAKPRPN